MKPLLIILTVLFLSQISSAQWAPPSDPPKVDLCTLAKEPEKYDRKWVEVTGYITFSFENETILMPCKVEASIWWVFDGQQKDDNYEAFNKVLFGDKGWNNMVRGTFVGQFFTGTLGVYRPRHKLQIRSIKSFEPHDRTDIDYRFTRMYTSYNIRQLTNCSDTLAHAWDKDADFEKDFPQIAAAAEQNPARNSSLEVAKSFLAETLKIDKSRIKRLDLKVNQQGSMVYAWKAGHKKSYWVTVGRPYVLLPYLKDPDNFPWVGITIFGCE